MAEGRLTPAEPLGGVHSKSYGPDCRKNPKEEGTTQDLHPRHGHTAEHPHDHWPHGKKALERRRTHGRAQRVDRRHHGAVQLRIQTIRRTGPDRGPDGPILEDKRPCILVREQLNSIEGRITQMEERLD